MSFVVTHIAQNSYIGLKTLFFLITPTPKFWRWRGKFYRIESWVKFYAQKLGWHLSEALISLLSDNGLKNNKFM
jgi:hypothetical protein